MNHAEARRHIITGFGQTFAREPSRSEAQVLGGIAWLETHNGDGWKDEGVGSNNMGAIQDSKLPCNPERSFQYTDTSPQPDGSSKSYKICFRKYKTPADGFADLCRVVYGTPTAPPDSIFGRRYRSVLPAAQRGDLLDVSRWMYRTRYYEGHGVDAEERIANHHRVLVASVARIARALDEPMPDGLKAPARTLKLGSTGTDVAEWQRVVGVTSTGMFDALTDKHTREWQRDRGLKVDGIVGPLTRASGSYRPPPVDAPDIAAPEPAPLTCDAAMCRGIEIPWIPLSIDLDEQRRARDAIIRVSLSDSLDDAGEESD